MNSNKSPFSWLRQPQHKTLAVALIALCLATTALQADELISALRVPENSSGLAFDGRLLWMGGVGSAGEWIRGLDPATGFIVDSIRAPVPDCIGLSWSENGLIYLSSRADSTFLVSRNGAVVKFANPVRYMAGIANEGEDLWAGTYFGSSGRIMKINGSGRVINSLPYNGRHSRDMAFHKGRLFIADRLSQEVRIINPATGRMVRSFRTPGVNPDGIATDGTYLWVMDDGDEKTGDNLYQYWISPDGNIRFGSLFHNFGSVVVNNTVTWVLWIYNDGARPARLSSFRAVDGNDDIIVPHVWNFPESIAAGDSVGLRISFQPAYADSVAINFVFVYDIDRQEYVVNVRGKGVYQRRDLLVNQRQLDFGMARFGEHLRSSNIRWLEVENNGGDPLTIESLRFSDASFSYGFYDFPLTLRRPGLYLIPIFFRPNRAGNIEANLTLTSDDPDNREVRINLVGQARLRNYSGGEVLWHMPLGDQNSPVPRVRAIQDIDDVTGDGLADVVVATNDYRIAAFHAATTDLATSVWSYGTNVNPWRSGLVMGAGGLSEGSDWDGDGVKDIVFGLSAGAQTVTALSGRTGTEIWVFDSHGLRNGGGHIRKVDARHDFNGDRFNDVYAVCGFADEQHSTNALLLLNGRNGRLIWQHILPAPPLNAMTIMDVTGDDVTDIVVVCNDGRIYAVDGEGGNRIWDAAFEGTHIASFPLNDVNGDGSIDLGVVTQMNGIVTFNGSNGVRLWRSRNFDRLTTAVSPGDLNRNGSSDIVFTDEFSFIRSIDGRSAAAVWDTTIYAGSAGTAIDALGDLNGDGVGDFIVGTRIGRLYALSGDGRFVLWSYSNVGEGHSFNIVKASRDLDGNGEKDVFASMENGTMHCLAGSYIGRQEVAGPGGGLVAPEKLTVAPAYPNPFNSLVALPVHLRERAEVKWRVFNVLGQVVYSANFGSLPAGSHRLMWHGGGNDGASLVSGVYLIEVSAADERVVRKVELLR